MPKSNTEPESLRPYIFHGVDLQYRTGDKDARGDCLFCAREGKFNVLVETGQYRCVVCGEAGNIYTFLRKLHDLADGAITGNDYEPLRKDRRLLHASTLSIWRIAKSPLTNDWLVPGYNEELNLTGLYRYADNGQRMLLIPTPTLGHHLLGGNLYDAEKPGIYLCEGVWDATALWEMLGLVKQGSSGLVPTGNSNSSLLAAVNVLAIPAAQVFKEAWLPLFAGKVVYLMAHNDHEGMNGKTNQPVPSASYAGMERIARLLSASDDTPEDIQLLSWGDGGYSLELPSGYDIRDQLNA